LWFSNDDGQGHHWIGRITTAGKVTWYPNIVAGHLTTGSDGALWFTSGHSIGRMTVSGSVTYYPVSTNPLAITVGPDGALWFTSVHGNIIGRITTAGVVTTYSVAVSPSPNSRPQNIVTGPDGVLWFTNYETNAIETITTPPYSEISPASGAPGTTVTLTGGGFSPGETVNFEYKTGLSSPSKVLLCSDSADTDGSVSCTATIPADPDSGAPGVHKVQANGMTSLTKVTTKFTLT